MHQTVVGYKQSHCRALAFFIPALEAFRPQSARPRRVKIILAGLPDNQHQDSAIIGRNTKRFRHSRPLKVAKLFRELIPQKRRPAGFQFLGALSTVFRAASSIIPACTNAATTSRSQV